MNAPAETLDAPDRLTGVWALFVGVSLAVTGLMILVEPNADLRASITLGGLAGLGVALLHPAAFRTLRSWSPKALSWFVAGVTLWVVVLPAQRFDPYMLAIVLAATVCSVHACAQLGGRLTSVAVVVWLVLWLPLDLRWFRYMGRSSPGFYLSNDLGYNVWALATACMGVLAFGAAGRFDVGIQRTSLKAPLYALAVGIVFGAIAIPVGLSTGFLNFKGDEKKVEAPANPNVEAAPGDAAPEPEPESAAIDTAKEAVFQVLLFFAIALTIAFPEELFFRGVLDRGLLVRWKRPWLALIVSSLLFGLMHWNNRKDLDDQLVYLVLASLAGIAYGLSFRKGGLISAIFLHALVDWVWQLEFSK